MNNLKTKENRTSLVVMLTAITMVVEIFFGLITGSMALFADGIHMGSHVLAIGLAWIAYVFVRKSKENDKFSGDSAKILSLSGYTSGLLLLIFAVFIIIKAIERFINPVDIHFKEAILVASIGLIVNIISAFLLHHDGEDADQNIRAAYLHVIADALTSVSAIIGLLAAMIWGLLFVDAIAAIVSSFIIIKWSVGLLRQSGFKLLDMKK